MLHWAPEEGRTCYRLCPEGLPEWGRRRPHRPWNRTGFPLGKLGRGDTRGWTGLTLQPSPPRGFTPGGIPFLSWLPKLGQRYQNPTQQDPFFSLQIVREKKQRWGCLSPHLCALPSLGPGRPPEGPPGLAKLPTLSLPDGHSLQLWPNGHLVSLGVTPQPPQPSAPPSQPPGTSLLPVPPPPCLAHSCLKAHTGTPAVPTPPHRMFFLGSESSPPPQSLPAAH